MQRQPESSMFDTRASIDSLSAVCESIFQIIASDSFVLDELSNNNENVFFPAPFLRRKSSTDLMSRPMESFNCSFSSLKLEEDEPCTITTMMTPVVDEDDDDTEEDASSSSYEDTIEVVPMQQSKVYSDVHFPMIPPSNPFGLVTKDGDEYMNKEQSDMPPPRPVSMCSSTSSMSSTTSTTTTTPVTITTIDGDTVVMDQLGPYDVVCGRNSSSYNSTGNRRFRVLITMNVDRYIAAPSREDKTRVVQHLTVMLVDEIGCRFLKRTGKGQFVEMDRKQIKEKIGHSLRDLVNLKKKGIKVGF